MGQTCAKQSCYSVEPEALEGSRADSPDPVMYDIMRKSIQATNEVRRHPASTTSGGGGSAYHNHSSASSSSASSGPVASLTGGGGNKHSKRQLNGQYHLLYKHGGSSSNPLSMSMSKSVSNHSSSNSHTHQYHQQHHSESPPRATGSGNSKSGASASSSSNLVGFGGSRSGGGKHRDKKDLASPYPTRLLTRRRSQRLTEEGGGTHIYAIRYPESSSLTIISQEQAPTSSSVRGQEQCPPRGSSSSGSNNNNSNTTSSSSSNSNKKRSSSSSSSSSPSGGRKSSTSSSSPHVPSSASMFPPLPFPTDGGEIFTSNAMSTTPRFKILDWVIVSEEHKIYIADIGITPAECDHIVKVTEDVCRGQYAAYTYAKQTLGCREFPNLAHTCFHPVHTTVNAIGSRLKGKHLQLDDREPHIVKYDVTRKERQKLDMHTDKSEWTFLIALSNGCGVDYEGGGTYFECLDSTVHIQRGHALIFPGKLRHCGQKITSGLRFLLVGFLVDKTLTPAATATTNTTTSNKGSTTTTTTTKSSSSNVIVSSLTSGISSS
eukprot:CAMPEP_0119554502 /NCGR_PEP_ID=MMETSP1352-20130426/6970_1 /TAXON_ID=265584 /ORGANISM="Stauroneis constricta, Strain CCMP1120" /LENGTH=545 /DNA_ID=CAMNT_0007601107 /DNA_START=784 /DNA_END=2421 /DNA_ORIENTATION=-